MSHGTPSSGAVQAQMSAQLTGLEVRVCCTCVTVCCSVLQRGAGPDECPFIRIRGACVLQLCCSVVQAQMSAHLTGSEVRVCCGCVAVCCSVRQCVAQMSAHLTGSEVRVCCSVLQCVAVCCRAVQAQISAQLKGSEVHVCCCVFQCVAVCCTNKCPVHRI